MSYRYVIFLLIVLLFSPYLRAASVPEDMSLFQVQKQSLIQSLQFKSEQPVGRSYHTRINEVGVKFYYALDVPKDYQIKKAYPLHIFLHGLVSRAKGRKKQALDASLADFSLPDSINVFPMGWKQAMWWTSTQVDNIHQIIEDLKTQYHIDTNRVFLHGVSDGGHGVYYLGAHTPTPFAGFIPIIASPFVLAPQNGAEHPTFLSNLINKPWLIINTSRDQLYPSKNIAPFVSHLRKAGATVEFISIEGAKHSVAWYENYRQNIIDFVNSNQRNPYPERLYWEVDAQLSYPRYHWLVIDDVLPTEDPKFVSLLQQGNSITINSQHISKLTLLLSPEQFDFSQEISIENNNELIFKGKVRFDNAILNKWYQVDHDIAQLYGAQLQLNLH
ncbi:hypothetical protein [Pseudoalteromonas tunicata]|nr:hypothetical protein [Pseudoalteromonas tunicata]ATC96626.1 hypothetical protein PTUN_b0187 [Pseudoalteromonas tunicata]